MFVTPPLGDWTLAVSAALFPPDRIETFAKPLVQELSGHFRDAQYFCTHKDAKLHAWARAQKGKFVRGYARDERSTPTVWSEGPQTKTERALGFRFTDAPGAPPAPPHPEDVAIVDESCVFKLAALWSVDPSALDEHFAEPVAGLIGEFPLAKA